MQSYRPPSVVESAQPDQAQWAAWVRRSTAVPVGRSSRIDCFDAKYTGCTELAIWANLNASRLTAKRIERLARTHDGARLRRAYPRRTISSPFRLRRDDHGRRMIARSRRAFSRPRSE
jgi:hypothetical protein